MNATSLGGSRAGWTRNAAKKNPSDPDAAEFMFSAYQNKVNLLNTVAEARTFNRQQD